MILSEVKDTTTTPASEQLDQQLPNYVRLRNNFGKQIVHIKMIRHPQFLATHESFRTSLYDLSADGNIGVATSFAADMTVADLTLQKIYYLCSKQLEDDALDALYDATERAFSEGNIQFVDLMLRDLEPKKVSRMISVGLLRGTYRARSLLESWRKCLNEVAVCLAETDSQRAQYALRGMIKKNDRSAISKG